MEQRAILSNWADQRGASGLTREVIRARLARPRLSRDRGDVATAMQLMAEGALKPHDTDRYGTPLSTGIPYDRGAGGVNASIKRVRAAVLVPLIERDDTFDVLLTMRPTDMKRHPGQVAFPGGRMEPEDRDAVACALREAEEEVGLSRAEVEVLGALDPYLTITGYEVTPVVGALKGPVMPIPDPKEVADVFNVPLSFLLDPANHQRVERDFNGLRRAYYAMPYDNRYIWGATAGMILNFYELLAP